VTITTHWKTAALLRADRLRAEQYGVVESGIGV
jgi:hypothetical protein